MKTAGQAAENNEAGGPQVNAGARREGPPINFITNGPARMTIYRGRTNKDIGLCHAVHQKVHSQSKRNECRPREPLLLSGALK